MKLFEISKTDTKAVVDTRVKALGLTLFRHKILGGGHVHAFKVPFFRFRMYLNRISRSVVRERAAKALMLEPGVLVFSGIGSAAGEYNFMTFSARPEDFILVADPTDDAALVDCDRRAGRAGFIPFAAYRRVRSVLKPKAKIFVLGNSYHNSMPLLEAIRTKGEPNRYLFLHEAQMLGCLGPVLKSKAVHGPYGGRGDIKDRYYVRPLVELTGITEIFVCNEFSRGLVLSDLTPSQRKAVHVRVVPIWMRDLSRFAKTKVPAARAGVKTIGVFGIPGESKMTREIAAAADMLVARGVKLRLVLAGRGVADWTCEQKIDSPNMEVYDAPSDELFFGLMKSADLVVQLRRDNHGEGSGTIPELVSLGATFMTTEGFISALTSEVPCYIVGNDISVEDLADEIEKALKKPKLEYDSAALVRKYSFENLAACFAEAVPGRPA